MIARSDLNLLVSNIVSEDNYKHCRLCLKSVDENFTKLENTTQIYLEEKNVTLAQALQKIGGDQICHVIPGIDAICMDCVKKTIEFTKFIYTCEESTNLLNNIFDNLSKSLNVSIDIETEDERLYIVVSETDSKTILIKKDSNKVNKPNTKYFQCSECNVVYSNINDIKVHSLTTHGRATCETCYDTCTNADELQEHEESTVTYKCPDCDQYRCTEKSLITHQDKCHSVYVCKECGKSFQGLTKLQIHELKHANRSTCPKCGKNYSTKEFYLRHIRLCMEDLLDPHPMRSKIKKSHCCDKCGKGYSTPGGLRVHNRFVHENAKPLECPICNKHFTAPSYLKVHMVKHTGERNFECEICKRKFVSKEALLYHTRRHTGEKPYSCHLCEEKFVNASARAEHIKFKHRGPTLMCEICSRKFFTPTFLRLHIKKHHDPTNKLYAGRCLVPPNSPQEQNVRCHFIEK